MKVRRNLGWFQSQRSAFGRHRHADHETQVSFRSKSESFYLVFPRDERFPRGRHEDDEDDVYSAAIRIAQRLDFRLPGSCLPFLSRPLTLNLLQPYSSSHTRKGTARCARGTCAKGKMEEEEEEEEGKESSES
ncbi:hypothetical protein M0802_010811 [Mischocyttarus mexicanus]|nr:hypothetical protein M0802_010811 [Mischocyttarus mexicanus]